ncbi:LLM class flavin-dependent oxidoreductase [Pseudonocardia sp. D17]|uniref:LLM class flavin-dependent oxidoreductase n=1 Tax=Pseudonocardia sp. D17 TaxID=882661 RepID=UPI002B3DBF45|nr:FMN-linked alkanal monooxygenase [Pseudonocardia sp. D17]
MNSAESSVGLSVLDTSPIVAGSDARAALHNTLDLAKSADELGFTRYWVPEHHGMRGVACSATAVVIDRIAASTERIRVGSGGVLLPNHSPLVLAEQFGTLEIYHPGRVDLGIGRALGGRKEVVERVRSSSERTAKPFEQQLGELLGYFAAPLEEVAAVPAIGNTPAVWLLGTSACSARLAGTLGLSYAYGGHLDPSGIERKLEIYRESFRSVRASHQPQVIVSVPVIAADTDDRAAWLAASIKRKLLARLDRKPILLPSPTEANSQKFTPGEEARLLNSTFSGYIVGSADTIRRKLQRIVDETGAQELMVTSPIFSHLERRRSYEICAGLKLKRTGGT